MIEVKRLCRTLKVERTNRKLNLTKRPTTLNVYSGGKRGLKGETATIQVGEVTTLPNGSIPTVTNTGDDHDAIFNFGIPQGGKGEGGDLNFVENFTNEQTVTVEHNLGKYPSVTVIDSTGSEVEGDIEHLGLNAIKLTFSSSFTGKATLN